MSALLHGEVFFTPSAVRIFFKVVDFFFFFVMHLFKLF